MNKPYWTWENKWEFDSLKPIHKIENDNDVYYLLLPGFNKENLTVTHSTSVIGVKGKRVSGGVGDDEINLNFMIKNNGTVNASIVDGILRIEVVSINKESKQIELQ